MSNRQVADVIIVGAGLSGLYAAKLLRAEGFALAVVEARDRVGGRIFSQPLSDGTAVDLGAQWIGAGQQRMYALAKAYGLQCGKTYAQGDAVVKIGQAFKRRSAQLPPTSPIGLLDLLQVSWRINRSAKRLSAVAPWQYPSAKQLDNIPFSHWIKSNTFSEEARAYWCHIAEGGICASSESFSALEVMHQIAAIGGLERLETADSEFFIEGAQTIPQRIADELCELIYLNAPVRSLKLQAQQVQVVTDRGDFYGKRIILALPPQLIERISLDPVLSAQFAERPRHLVLGKVVKSVVVYESAWWRRYGLSGMADTPDELINFMADTSHSDHSGVLVAIASGSKAVELSQMDEAARKAAVLSHVHKVLGQAPSSPTKFFSMDWIHEQYSQGGYASRRAVGEWVNAQAELACPVGLIHFAGTETATIWKSYMEGALQAAERASKEVAAAIRGEYK